jgi:transposase
MIHIDFTDETIAQLRYERYHHPHPRVQMKMETLFLKSQGLSHGEIGKLVGVCQDTVREYFTQYKNGGIEALKVISFYQPKSELAQHSETIENEFRINPPMTIKEAANRIKELTRIERSENRVRKFLKKNRLKTFKDSTNSGEGRRGSTSRISG